MASKEKTTWKAGENVEVKEGTRLPCGTVWFQNQPTYYYGCRNVIEGTTFRAANEVEPRHRETVAVAYYCSDHCRDQAVNGHVGQRCHDCGERKGSLPCRVGSIPTAVWLCQPCRANTQGPEVTPWILAPVPTSPAGDRYEGHGSDPCLICGKEMRSGSVRWTTCLVDGGGGGLLHPAWSTYLDLQPEEDHPLVRTPMGGFPVGQGCYRRHRLQEVASRA